MVPNNADLTTKEFFWKWFFDSILFYSIILLYYFFLLFDNPAANLQPFLRGQPYSSSVSHCIYQLWTWRSPGTMTLKMAFVIYIFLGIFLKTHNTFFTEHLWTQFVLSNLEATSLLGNGLNLQFLFLEKFLPIPEHLDFTFAALAWSL